MRNHSSFCIFNSAFKSLAFVMAAIMMFTSVQLPVSAKELDTVFTSDFISTTEMSTFDGADSVTAQAATSEHGNVVASNANFGDIYAWTLYEDGFLEIADPDLSVKRVWAYFDDRADYIKTATVHVSADNEMAHRNNILSRLFEGCENLTSVEIYLNHSEYKTSYLFKDCASLKKVTFVGEGSVVFTETYSMFENCAPVIDWTNITSLTTTGHIWGSSNYSSLSFEGLDNITYTSMPSCTKAMTTYDLSKCNLAFEQGFAKSGANVFTVGSTWFGHYTNLTYVNFGGIDAVEDANLSRMFQFCSNLKTVDFSGCDFANVADATDMFYACNALETVVTPIHLKWTCKLPCTMYDENGTAYDRLPQNSTESVTLTKTPPCPEENEGSGDGNDVETPIEKRAITFHAIPDHLYTGKANKPDVIIFDGEKQLVKGKDYTLSYANNVNVNTVKGNGISIDCDTTMNAEFRIRNDELSTNYFYIDENGNTTEITNSEFRILHSTLSESGSVTAAFDETLPTVIVKGKGSYSGVAKLNFNINAVRMDLCDIFYTSSFDAGDKDINPVTSVKFGKSKLVKDRDYTVSITNKDGKELGSAIPAGATGTFAVTITGIGNYAGVAERTVIVADKEKNLKNAAVTVGKNLKAIPFATFAGEIPFGYYDEASKTTYKVENGEVTGTSVDKNDVVTVKIGKTYLVEGRDFAMYYDNSKKKAGKNSAELFGCGEYAGSKAFNFTVKGEKVSAKKAAFSGWVDTCEYTGSAIKQDFTVTYGGVTYTTEDMTVVYKNNVKKGSATVTIQFAPKTGLEGKLTKKFKITAAPLTKDMVTSSFDAEYNKKGATLSDIVVKKDGQILVDKKDYTISYKNNKGNAGTKGTVIIKGKGNYTGTFNSEFRILHSALDAAAITVTGIALDPKKGGSYEYKNKVTVKVNGSALKVGTDFAVSYKNNTNADIAAGKTAVAVVSPMGNYKGEAREVVLPVYTAKLSTKNTYVVVGNEGRTWVGSRQLTPKVAVYYGTDSQMALAKKTGVYTSLTRLAEGEDFFLVYGSNNTVGKNKGSVTVYGCGDFGGQVSAKFEIRPKGFDYVEDADGDGVNDDSNPADEEEGDREDPGYVAYNEIIADFYYADPADGYKIHYTGLVVDWHPATSVTERIHQQFDYVVTEEQMKKNGVVCNPHPDADPDWLEVYGSVGYCEYYTEEGEHEYVSAQVDWYPRWGYVTHFYHGKPVYPEFLFEK